MTEDFFADPAYQALAGKKILIAEDEADLRDILQTLLAKVKAEVSVSENGEKADLMLRDQAFDLVISDVRMAGGDGVSLLQKIRHRDPVKPPVVLVTGYADITIEEAKSRGAIDVIAKPFRLKTILDRLVLILS